MKLEIRVEGSENSYNRIVFGNSFQEIDSLRLTAYIIYLINRNGYTSDFNSFREKIEEDKIYFAVSSPFFIEKNLIYLPVSSAFYTWLARFVNNKEALDTITNKKKQKPYLPILELMKTNIENFVKNFILEDKDSEKVYEFRKEIRIRNVIDRITSQSINLYPIVLSSLNPFHFLIKTNWEKIELIKSTLFGNEAIHFIGKRISIGYGKVKFYHDNTFPEEKIECEKTEEGYYYLMNRIPINEKILESVEIERSYYDIIKVKGYLPSENGKLVGRSLICFKEGSILYFKGGNLKNYCFKIDKNKGKNYFVVIRPMLIKIGEKVWV